MDIAGDGEAEATVEEPLERGGIKQIGPADNVRDPLGGIIDHGELIGVQPIGPPDYEITDVFRGADFDGARAGRPAVSPFRQPQTSCRLHPPR